MGSFDVKQRTKDGMFNATELVKQWNKVEGNPKRDLSKFWEQRQTKEFLEVLMVDDEFLNTPKKGYLKTRGKYGGTWMHPYLFIKFAMWISPRFELNVIKFVHDQLIEFRHDAGDNYKKLAASASILSGVDYSRLAKAVNWIVFGKHAKELRQTATEKQLKELAEVQKQVSFAIDMGMIKDFDGLLALMRRMYNQKHSVAA